MHRLSSATDIKSVQVHRRGGSYFWLGPKVTKTQGLDLMLDKIVKAFIAAAQAPTKGREGHAALGSSILTFVQKL
jgi:hypothetical protein